MGELEVGGLAVCAGCRVAGLQFAQKKKRVSTHGLFSERCQKAKSSEQVCNAMRARDIIESKEVCRRRLVPSCRAHAHEAAACTLYIYIAILCMHGSL